MFDVFVYITYIITSKSFLSRVPGSLGIRNSVTTYQQGLSWEA